MRSFMYDNILLTVDKSYSHFGKFSSNFTYKTQEFLQESICCLKDFDRVTEGQQNSFEVPIFASCTEAQVLLSALRAVAAKHFTSHCPQGMGGGRVMSVRDRTTKGMELINTCVFARYTENMYNYFLNRSNQVVPLGNYK